MLALAGLVLVQGCVGIVSGRSAQATAGASSVRPGRVAYGAFASRSLGGDVAYAVSLPPSYDTDSSRRFPVVVFLHGLFNSERDWEGRGIQSQVDALRARHAIGEFIVAVPYGANSFYLNAKSGVRYEDAIVQDFIPFVDRTFRTTGTARGRAIEGISMGGFGALVIAFKHPELFSAVAAHCAAVFEEVPRPPASPADRRAAFQYELASGIFGDPPDAAFFAANNPLGLAMSQAKSLRNLRIYFDVGEQDRYGFAAGNRALDQALTRAGVAHEFHLTPGDHGWSYLVERSEPAFTFVSHALDAR